jgi:hypothetical protein
MAVFPSNILQQVQTYQRSSLALLLNLCCHISTANTKFKDFDKIQANLGSTVTLHPSNLLCNVYCNLFAIKQITLLLL